MLEMKNGKIRDRPLATYEAVVWLKKPPQAVEVHLFQANEEGSRGIIAAVISSLM
jgi:hypothetical protein